MDGSCGTFDIKSNYFGLLIPKKIKSFEKLNKRVTKCTEHVSTNRSKTTSLRPNLAVAASSKSKADRKHSQTIYVHYKFPLRYWLRVLA